VLEYHTEAEDSKEEFLVLDTSESKKQFILLVGKGIEGWNCRSLVSCALYRKPKSAIFVLQSSTRCLRSIGDNSTIASIFLSEDNHRILDKELKNEGTWYILLGHLLCRIRYSPIKYLRGSGTGSRLYVTVTRTATSTFAVSTGTVTSGTGTTIGSTTTSTTTTLRRFPHLASFLSLFGRVLFCQLSVPAAEHFAYLI
jgi:hypothetical protein